MSIWGAGAILTLVWQPDQKIIVRGPKFEQLLCSKIFLFKSNLFKSKRIKIDR